MTYQDRNAFRRKEVITFTPERKPRPPRQAKLKRWSHQDELDALKGQLVTLHLLDENPIRATLLEADQFTIKVDVRGGKTGLILFKSNLTAFHAGE